MPNSSTFKAERVIPKETSQATLGQSYFLNSYSLFSIRLLLSLWILFTILINISINYQDSWSFVLHLTNLNYYGLAAYMWTSTYFSYLHMGSPTEILTSPQSIIYKWYQLQFACSLVINTVVTINFFLWMAQDELVPANPPIYLFLTISMHILNSVIIYWELLVSKNRIKLRMLPVVVGVMIAYMIYIILAQAISGQPVYHFIDYTKSIELFLIIIGGTLLITIISFSFGWSLSILRDKIIAKRKQSQPPNL